MLHVDLKELQANLEYYFKKLEEGEKIEVLENGKPIYTLTEPFILAKAEQAPTAATAGISSPPDRKLGMDPGWLDPPDYLPGKVPDEIIDLFYNSELFPKAKGKA